MSNTRRLTSPLSSNYEPLGANPESPTSINMAEHIKILLKLEEIDPLFAERGVRRQLDSENFGMLSAAGNRQGGV